MSESEVRIVRLEPMWVAYAHGYGEQPEGIAWNTLLSWAKSKGLLDDLKACRFFGFNNPDPSPGSPNYGYEQWLAVEPEAEPGGEVKIKEFSGGLYAVAKCKLSNIGQVWKQLVTWREDGKYKQAHHQWLEECLNPEVFITSEGSAASDESIYSDVIFDLYLPIAE